MNQPSNCPSCGAKIRDNFLGVNSIMEDVKLDLIAEMTNTERKEGCSACLGNAFLSSVTMLRAKTQKIIEEIEIESENIPIVTVPSPLNWEYTVIGIATGQSTSGTGFLTDVASSWTDFFGLQSGAYNKKISEGELLCYKQVRAKAVGMGGNAIIAADIDYSEMGAGKAMIMVCVSGTVVRLHNPEIVSEHLKESMAGVNNRLEKISVWDSKYAQAIANY